MNKIKLLHMYPNMLDLYGDSGNVEIIKYRCKKRDIELEVSSHIIGDDTNDFSQYDIVYLGGGADLEQQILADDLLKCKDAVRKAYENGTFFLMICGGYQLLGQYYKGSNGEKIPGLALFDYYTVASTDKGKRSLTGKNIKSSALKITADRPRMLPPPLARCLPATATVFPAIPRGIWRKMSSLPISTDRFFPKTLSCATTSSTM